MSGNPDGIGHTLEPSTTATHAGGEHYAAPRLAPDSAEAVAANRLRSAEARFRALMKTTGQLIWSARADGTVVNADTMFADAGDGRPAWCAFTGQSTLEASGWGWLDAVHPDDRERVRRRWEQAALDGQSSSDQYRVRRADGEYRTLLDRAAPVYDAAGRLEEWVGIATDVTDAVQAEEERARAFESLLAATERGERLWLRTRDALEALLDMARILVTVPGDSATGEALSAMSDQSAIARRLVELARRVLSCRRARVVMLEPETRLLRALAIAGATAEQEEKWRRAVDGVYLYDRYGAEVEARLFSGEAVVVRAGPPPFNSRLTVVVPLRVGAQIIGFLGIDYDGEEREDEPDATVLEQGTTGLAALLLERDRLLRERERALADEMALREATRRMDEFLGVASHELRTPMTTILGNIQLAQRRMRHAYAQHQGLAGHPDVVATIPMLLDRALKQTQQISGLVEDLLDVTRIREGRLELRLAAADLVAIVRAVVGEQRGLAPHRAITLDVPADAIPVMVDASRIAQVVTNFLTNALKYSTADHAVIVFVERIGQGANTYARVGVRDHGPGLSSDYHDSVWERFSHVPGVTPYSGTGGGLGLGLYISKTIVERHGGRVGVDSTPGEGATFWCTVPLAPA